MTTLTLPAVGGVHPVYRGAHRRPFPLTTVVIWGGTSLVSAGILAAGILGMIAPRSACHAVPMHLGWPNSHCSLPWHKWKPYQP